MTFPVDAIQLSIRHIAEGEKRVRKQERLVRKLMEAGLPWGDAQSLLECFLVTMKELRTRRDLLLTRIDYY